MDTIFGKYQEMLNKPFSLWGYISNNGGRDIYHCSDAAQ